MRHPLLPVTKGVGQLVIYISLAASSVAQQLQSPGFSSTADRLRSIEAKKCQAARLLNSQWRSYSAQTYVELDPTCIVDPVMTPSQIHALRITLGPSLSAGEACFYYWPGWRLVQGTHKRTTLMRCKNGIQGIEEESPELSVTVNCQTLQMKSSYRYLSALSTRKQRVGIGWTPWRYPSKLSEKLMMEDLCDNLTEN